MNKPYQAMEDNELNSVSLGNVEHEEYDRLAQQLLKDLSQSRPPLARLNDLSHGETGILLALSRRAEGELSGELSRELHLSTGRVASALKDLEVKGMICRRVDSCDGRRVLVYLTAYGADYAAQCRCRIMNYVLKLLSGLGPQDAAEFVRLMRRICKIERSIEHE